jgi:hypothetical protein
VPTVPLANVRLAEETVRGEESVPARLMAGRRFIEGVNLLWANADEPRMRRENKRIVPPKNRFVPYFAGFELELWR